MLAFFFFLDYRISICLKNILTDKSKNNNPPVLKRGITIPVPEKGIR